jgi:hypothetical protein
MLLPMQRRVNSKKGLLKDPFAIAAVCGWKGRGKEIGWWLETTVVDGRRRCLFVCNQKAKGEEKEKVDGRPKGMGEEDRGHRRHV